MEFVIEGKMTAGQAAKRLHMSVRQIFRIKAKYLEKGAEALVHGNRGRKPVNTIPQEVRNLIIDLAKGDYHGASLNHISELLEERNEIRVSAKTVGNIMKEAGLNNNHSHKGKRKRRIRERREQEGELVQIDASPFDWLEIGKNYSLHGAIDDATGKVLSAHLEATECMKGYILMLEKMMKKHGIPASVYSDRHTIFFSQQQWKLSEPDDPECIKTPLTQYGRMLYDLGIEHIAAHSPQAKGRIERLWGTFQHRLVVELRLAKIKTIEAANEFLKLYLDKYNNKFAYKARFGSNVYLPCPEAKALSLILSVQEERKATGGSEICFEGRRYQLKKGKENILMRKGEKVTVLRSADRVIRALRNGEIYDMAISPSELAERDEGVQNTTEMKNKIEKKKNIPATDHPWRLAWRTKNKSQPGTIRLAVKTAIL